MNLGSEDGKIAEAFRGIMDVVLSDLNTIDFNLPRQTFGYCNIKRVVRSEVVGSFVR